MDNRRDENKKILIYGAGAIGRGYLAPVFNRLGYKIYFVDIDQRLVDDLKTRNFYKTAFSEQGMYEIVEVRHSGAFLLGEEDNILDSVDIVFSCVGPSNFQGFVNKLGDVPSIISFENEIESVEQMKTLSNNPHCYFGIPDVIASNTVPPELLEIDPLCLVSEKGDLAIEEGNFDMPRQIPVYDKEAMKKYWHCKFYLHNTPHATIAFLGKLMGIRYIHEAIKIPIIEYCADSIMESTKKAMLAKDMADMKFMNFYISKEMARFKDDLLFDPISRVGREPLRKLRAHDRLIKSAKMLHETGQDISAVCLTIKAAIFDALKNQKKNAEHLSRSFMEKSILKKVCELDEKEHLFKAIARRDLFETLFSLPMKDRYDDEESNELGEVTTKTREQTPNLC